MCIRDSHNSIQPNQPDPGFSVEDYVQKKFGKVNSDGNEALEPTKANTSYANDWYGTGGGPF